MNEGPLYPGHPTLWEANTYLCSADGWDIHSGHVGGDTWIYALTSPSDNNYYSTTYRGDDDVEGWSRLPPSVQALARAYYQLIQ